jgi:hypothetical protein
MLLEIMKACVVDSATPPWYGKMRDVIADAPEKQ